jgi:aspartyl protease family protein
MITWALRQVVQWLVVGSLLVAAYVHRDVWVENLRGGAPANDAPSRDAVSSGQSVRLRAERNGHFFVVGKVDGMSVRFMVDTGATVIALTGEDARRLGLTPTSRDRAETHWTANGTVRVAPVRLKDVQIGSIVVRDVEAVVNERMDGVSLLGMSFLRRLAGFSVQGNELVLSR